MKFQFVEKTFALINHFPWKLLLFETDCEAHQIILSKVYYEFMEMHENKPFKMIPLKKNS